MNNLLWQQAATIRQQLDHAAALLRAAGIEGARREARLLLIHALGQSECDLLRDPEALVPSPARDRMQALIARRCRREPLAYLTGRAGFWTLELSVSPATLIPRPDSETVVEAALNAFSCRQQIRSILDLGTGSGALLLAVLAECPQAIGVGVDISAPALAVAARNAAAHGLAARASFVCSDWAEAIEARFDLVLCNPPYIASGVIPQLMPEIAHYEPRCALDGGADGLAAFRRLLPELPRLLRRDSRAVLEIGKGQGAAVGEIAWRAGLRIVGCRYDFGGVERALIVARA